MTTQTITQDLTGVSALILSLLSSGVIDQPLKEQPVDNIATSAFSRLVSEDQRQAILDRQETKFDYRTQTRVKKEKVSVSKIIEESELMVHEMMIDNCDIDNLSFQQEI